MDLKELIKNNLLEFIKTMYAGSEDEFSDVLNHYGNTGKEAFYADLDRAIVSLAKLSNDDFTSIYENLRDIKPAKRGVLLSENLMCTGSFNLDFIKYSNNTDIHIPDFVFDWAEETLQNPYYTDLLSHLVKYNLDTVDQHGYLARLEFQAHSCIYVLITDQFEFMPVRVNEIYIRFTNGAELSLFKNVIFNESNCPYETLNEFLTEIIDLDSKLLIKEN